MIAASADVGAGAVIGEGCSIWHLAQVREGAVLGRQCVVGRGAYVGAGVLIGDHVKIQNYALVYEPAILGDGAFIGPAAVLTNDTYPRSVTASGELKRADDWSAQGVRVGVGASVGAHAVVLAGVTVGDWALIAAGAVVSRDVPPHACVAGVPARQIGWVGRVGRPLVDGSSGLWSCAESGEIYELRDGMMRRVE